VSRVVEGLKLIFGGAGARPEPNRDAAAPVPKHVDLCSCEKFRVGPENSVTRDGTIHRLDVCEPAPVDFECTCGCSDFTTGGQVVRVNRDGARVGGNVLTCLGCGERWYNTARGLRRPHEAALPPAWSMAMLQGKAAKAQADAQHEREQRRLATMGQQTRGPAAGFRTPPAPEPS